MTKCDVIVVVMDHIVFATLSSVCVDYALNDKWAYTLRIDIRIFCVFYTVEIVKISLNGVQNIYGNGIDIILIKKARCISENKIKIQ